MRLLVATALKSGVSLRAFQTPQQQVAGTYRPGSLELVVKGVEGKTDAYDANSTEDDLCARSIDSERMLPYWQKTDDIVEGYDAIKKASTTYLPMFPDEDQTDYDFRLNCTKFTNIYSDIIESLSSKPFEEETTLIEDDGKPIPDIIKELVEDVDGSGSNLTMFANATFYKGINSAIDWIFIDYPKTDITRIRTQADAKADGVRPFWSHVLGRNVLEVRSKVINGKELLTYMRILEPASNGEDHVRVFVRDELGAVTWSLWRKVIDRTATKAKFVKEDEGIITIGVIPLVPFVTGRRDGRTWYFKPVMKDAADLQIELYDQESALKFTKKLAAFPMLAGNGVVPEKMADNKTPKKIRVGPKCVLYAPPNGNGDFGSWAYVEPSATTLKFLADDVKETIQNLRELGRQPLTASTGNLTVITTAFAAGKAKTAVGAWALGLKNTLENALVVTCLWLNISVDAYDPQVNVYTEFDEFIDGQKDLETLDKARDRRDISHRTYTLELQRRKVLSPEFDHEKEMEYLLEEGPADDTGDEDIEPVKKPEPVK